MIVKRGHKAINSQIVNKRNKTTKVVISILLAISGIVISVMAYQYTYSAKLEQELNNKANVIQQKSTEIQKQSETLNLTETQKQELQKQVDELNKQKEELNKQLQAKQAEKARVAQIQAAQAQSAPKVVNNTAPAQTASVAAVSGSKYDWLSQAGVPQSDWQYADYIISKESGWNPNAVNKSSGACSLAQSLPCSKIGPDWRNPVTAIKWQYGYVKARYGGYAGAYQFWLVNKWY